MTNKDNLDAVDVVIARLEELLDDLRLMRAQQEAKRADTPD